MGVLQVTLNMQNVNVMDIFEEFCNTARRAVTSHRTFFSNGLHMNWVWWTFSRLDYYHWANTGCYLKPWFQRVGSFSQRIEPKGEETKELWRCGRIALDSPVMVQGGWVTTPFAHHVCLKSQLLRWTRRDTVNSTTLLLSRCASSRCGRETRDGRIRCTQTPVTVSSKDKFNSRN